MTEIRDKMFDHGIPAPDGMMIEDGAFHRYGKKKEFWYVISGETYGFGNWKTNTVVGGHIGNSEPINPQERAEMVERWETEKIAAEIIKVKENKAAAKRARSMWELSTDEIDHKYIIKKRISPPVDSIRQQGDTLLIPIFDNGELVNIQKIKEDGTKRFSKGGKIKGCYGIVGKPNRESSLILAEGFATACSLLENYPNVSAAFYVLNSGNFMEAAKSIMKRFPGGEFIVAADNDYFRSDGNIGLEKAREAAKEIGARVIVPPVDTGNYGDEATDFNDYFNNGGLIKDIVEDEEADDGRTIILRPLKEMVMTREYVENAEMMPRCIVENYLYADLAQLVAPGGVGKTTMLLYESVCISLGLDVWGNKVIEKDGHIILVTAEDNIERLGARLFRIMKGMDLSNDQIDEALSKIHIIDVTGRDAKLVAKVGYSINLTGLPARLCRMYRDDNIAMVVFDPLVSFGAGEDSVNTNEQELVHAARMMINRLNCCVRYVHHTGQSKAEEKTLSQYAGRNGSAMSDGCRMVTVIQPWNDDGGVKGISLNGSIQFERGSKKSIIIMARPKMSYCPPNLPKIIIERDGYKYSHEEELFMSSDDIDNISKKKIFDFINERKDDGDRYSLNNLYDNCSIVKVPKREMKRLVASMIENSQLEEIEVIGDDPKSRKRKVLIPSIW